MQKTVDVIIPTYDNLDQLHQSVTSMLSYRTEWPLRIIIVNNGHIPIEEHFRLGEMPGVEVIKASENLGWIGGLREGLKHSTSEYVVFANDDIFVPRASYHWLRNMARELEVYPAIGAIGPTSNVVMGQQNIWAGTNGRSAAVPFLIGFCMMVRRSALDAAGGVQDMEFGGDDLDLSLRLRKAGYHLVVLRDIFVYHHGFQTGNKLHGTPDKPNGWNSREMTDNVNMELIRKHGFIAWWAMMTGGKAEDACNLEAQDAEGEMVRGFCRGAVVLELGCGSVKTVPHAIGVDVIPAGEVYPYTGQVSVADVVADVSKQLPFPAQHADTIIARHVLEHCVDTVRVLTDWRDTLKPQGRLILSLPDEDILDGVPMNPEHVHAFTPESVRSLADLLEFKVVGVKTGYNYHSFTICLEKK